MKALYQDIEILSKDYSSYRCAPKWRTNRIPSSSSSPLLSHNTNFISIFRNSLLCIDIYPIPSLLKRQEIKRSPDLFNSITNLWEFINPACLRSLQKSVFLVILEFFYKQFQQSMANPTLIKPNLLHDSKIDFHSKLGLTFAEFYDIIFEVVDSLAKSSLIGEYCKFAELPISALKYDEEFTALSLYSKLHLKDKQGTVHYLWMQELIEGRRREKLPVFGKKEVEEGFSKRILMRFRKKRVGERTPNRWEMILRKGKIEREMRSLTPTMERIGENENLKTRNVGCMKSISSITTRRGRE
jgi:hypothetical protein